MRAFAIYIYIYTYIDIYEECGSEVTRKGKNGKRNEKKEWKKSGEIRKTSEKTT